MYDWLSRISLLVACFVAGSASADAEEDQVLVLTGGEASVWRFELTPGWGEHLIFGPGHLYAARTYYYKGLLRYRERFERYLADVPNLSVDTVDLDYRPAPSSFEGCRAVILDDVRAAALAPAFGALRRYVESGGDLFIAAGAHGLGGQEIQKLELPTIEIPLLFDPPRKGSPYEPVSWTHYSTTSSYRVPDFESILPVRIISQPDLVVYDRVSHGGGRELGVRVVDGPLESFPEETWSVVGFHRVEAKEDAEVWSVVGPESDPLVVSRRVGKGRVTVLLENELESAVRLNGQPNNAAINSPVAGEEQGLWPLAGLFWETLVGSVLGEVEPVAVSFPVGLTVGDTGRLEVSGAGPWRVHISRAGDLGLFKPVDLELERRAAGRTCRKHRICPRESIF